MKNLEGCQYSVCCHNDEYQKLQQEKEELEKKMYLIIMELYSENIINANIEEMRNILEKLGE